MKCVHRTSDRTVAQLLRGALETEGVDAIVQGEHLAPLQGQLPAGASAEFGVAIIDDEQLPRAELLVRQWLADPATEPPGEAWVCGGCGERHEPHFESCWKCGADAGTARPLRSR
jgi:hypothetical protein